MTIFLGPQLFLALSLVLVSPAKSSHAHCNAMTAAVKADNRVIFFFGNTYVSFDSASGHQVASGSTTNLYGLHEDFFSVDAAYHPQADPTSTIIVSGQNYYRINHDRSVIGPHSLASLFHWNSELAEGLDAAVNFRGTDFYFRGCDLLVRFSSGTSRKYSLPQMGLPCNLGSAWDQDSYVIVTKGSQAWNVTSFSSHATPVCLGDFFRTRYSICECSAQTNLHQQPANSGQSAETHSSHSSSSDHSNAGTNHHFGHNFPIHVLHHHLRNHKRMNHHYFRRFHPTSRLQHHFLNKGGMNHNFGTRLSSHSSSSSNVVKLNGEVVQNDFSSSHTVKKDGQVVKNERRHWHN